MAKDEVSLIARRGDELYLLKRGEDGIVVDVEEVVRMPPLPLESVLSRGYWESEPHREDVADLLMQIPEQTADDAAADEKAFDPDQPRDDQGRWTGDGGSSGSAASDTSDAGRPNDSNGNPVSEQTAAKTVIMYHGTLASNIESISAEGIVPTSPKRFTESGQGERATKVFVTSNKAAAEWYAKTAALYGPPGSTHAVFEVHVPDDVLSAAPKDTSSVDSWMLDEVPPEWIKEVHKSASGDTVVFVPLAFAGTEEV